MSESIGCVVNFFREANMLHGFFETACRFFDEVIAVSAPPSAAPPDEESIAICQKWGVRVVHDTIDDGFGALRTRCLHAPSTEWTMIMDADERFLPVLPVYELHGTGRYPDQQDPQLSVGIGESSFNQGDLLRRMVDSAKNVDGIRFIRRHWMNFAMTRPAQRWDEHPDWQLRFLRNRGYLGYESHVRMHERCRDFRTNEDPSFITAGPRYGVFVDHFHVPAKLMEPEQRAEDIEIYNRLDSNRDINELFR
jgi:hypothetical protein